MKKPKTIKAYQYGGAIHLGDLRTDIWAFMDDVVQEYGLMQVEIRFVRWVRKPVKEKK